MRPRTVVITQVQHWLAFVQAAAELCCTSYTSPLLLRAAPPSSQGADPTVVALGGRILKFPVRLPALQLMNSLVALHCCLVASSSSHFAMVCYTCLSPACPPASWCTHQHPVHPADPHQAHCRHHLQVTRVPADKLVDTNGAGDAFVGGFLSQLVRRMRGPMLHSWRSLVRVLAGAFVGLGLWCWHDIDANWGLGLWLLLPTRMGGSARQQFA